MEYSTELYKFNCMVVHFIYYYILLQSSCLVELSMLSLWRRINESFQFLLDFMLQDDSGKKTEVLIMNDNSWYFRLTYGVEFYAWLQTQIVVNVDDFVETK